MKISEQELFDYLEGTLSNSDNERIGRQINEDFNLQNTLSSIKKADQFFEKVPLKKVSESFEEKVSKKVALLKNDNFYFIPVISLVALAIISITVVLLIPSKNISDPELTYLIRFNIYESLNQLISIEWFKKVGQFFLVVDGFLILYLIDRYLSVKKLIL